ncbi:glycosyltransferase family 9 protein [Pseudoduganella sp. GCM10020061]|uniref:glycosyltransferase family 9 protein n=1 Tax=Pseudoduganella sp. GCM10020061 TaxID=3317345 RepID=UPI00363ECBE7
MSTDARQCAPRKVLFFSHDGKLGDAIVNTAFVAGLARHNPGCEIHATVAGITAAFWEHDSRVARLWKLGRGWGEAIRTGLALRRERYDVIVTWQRMRSEKNRALLWLARPGRVIDLHEFNRAGVVHKIEACGEALGQAGVIVEQSELAYDVRIAARSEQVDAQFPPGQELIVINLFAADAERNVARADAVALLRGLQAAAPEAVLCLMCTDATAATAFAVVEESGTGQVMNCEGNLHQLFRLCERADVVVSPDTAVIHIASSFRTPVVGIYQNNGIKPVQWGPRGCASAVVLSQCPRTIQGFCVDEVVAQAAALRRRPAEAAAPAVASIPA